jgi:SNF2 family DNA or RNA helicase
MIANQKAGGVGINLVEASYSIYYSKSFSLEDDLQSEARNYRGGSQMHHRVTRIDLVARGTIDELITSSLANKQDVSQTILDWRSKI